MLLQKRTIPNRLGIFIMLMIGIFIVVLSAFYVSSFLAILGLAVLFWGVILFYILPSKHVPLALLNATSDLSNVDRLLKEVGFTEKGIYLPPMYLKNTDSSIVLIRRETGKPLPKPEEIAEKLFSKEKDCLYLTPPGFLLSQLFEQELGKSFNKMDLPQLQAVFRKLIVENLEIAEDVEMIIDENIVMVEVKRSLLNGICRHTQNMPQTHNSLGCVLTSAIACALAKVSGKPIIIKKEINNLPELTQIVYSFGVD